MADDKEVKDRVRRIETRLTGFMQWSGYNPGSEKPVWHPEGRVSIPTPGVSLRDMLAVVPADWPADEEIEVHHRNEWVASIMKPTTVPA